MTNADITAGFDDGGFDAAAAPYAVHGANDDRLADATAGLRSRNAITVDRWFQLAGGALLGLGLLAIVVGWYGAAHTTRSWRQTPYLISGGILGLGLIFIGGFSYFAYWMTRMVAEIKQQSGYLQGIESVLREQVRGTAGDDTAIVVTPTGVAHRATCPVIAGRPDVRPVTVDTPGLKPCPMCEPAVTAPA